MAFHNINYKGNFILPVGMIIPWAGKSDAEIPNGWLLCDGNSYSSTDYPDLFAAIGTTYGGTTELFKVPNLVDKFVEGTNDSIGVEMQAGLPNIKGTAHMTYHDGVYPSYTGAIEVGDVVEGATAQRGTGSGFAPRYTEFLASKSNTIYGKSTTVQPPAIKMRYLIKY